MVSPTTSSSVIVESDRIMKSFASLTEDVRESMLNAAADAIAQLHRHKLKFDVPEAPPAPDDNNGDFLYDFARLNLQYLNQLASLGSNYSALGARVLEKVHDYWAGPEKHDAAAEMTFVSGQSSNCTIKVLNPFGKRVSVSVAPPSIAGFTFTATPIASHVPAGKAAEIKLTAGGKLEPIGRYHDFTLPVTLTPSGGGPHEIKLKVRVRQVRS